jgi:hypothetical protein
MRDLYYISKKISKEKQIDLDIVEKVNKFYWKEVRRQMNSLDNTAVHVKNLLTFSVSRYNLRKEIQKVINKIRLIRTNNKFVKKEPLLAFQYEVLRKLLKSRNKLAILYKELYYNE